MNKKSLIIYADLNCPFCYTLHERLIELDLIDQVDWRSIEHAPSISYDRNNRHIQAELTQEVARVRELAPEINIITPFGRPNSGLANAIATEAAERQPALAAELRAQIYRSLWIDGHDFADVKILDKLCTEIGVSPVSPSLKTKHKLATWQSEWEHGDFSRNIPALVTTNGNKILGLPTTDLLLSLINGEHRDNFEDGAFCYIKPKEKVLIASTSDRLVDDLTTAIENYYNIEYAQYGEAVFQACLMDNPPDLIIMDDQLQEPNGFETCLKIKDHERAHNIPVIIVSDLNEVKTEIKAFDMGASDFIAMPHSPEVIRSRARVLLQLKRTTDLLERFSRLDSLTEIPNRREFDRIFEKEYLRAKRNHKPISIIMIDIDYFKKYNDHYGHMEGDQCLKKVAQLIEKSLRRPPDIVARYGGEEFVVILPETDEKGAKHVAEKIRHNLASLDLPHAQSSFQRISLSQGISTLTPNAKTTTKMLIDAADNALYDSKRDGRNRESFRSPTVKN